MLKRTEEDEGKKAQLEASLRSLECPSPQELEEHGGFHSILELNKEQLELLGKLNQMILDETEDGWEWKKGHDAEADMVEQLNVLRGKWTELQKPKGT